MIKKLNNKYIVKLNKYIFILKVLVGKNTRKTSDVVNILLKK
ncbi:MAG: hypothetical protein QTO32_00830 [Candidatus Organicella extenuata]|jgi:hypothetical protein|uniref:Uncharacterized protein n=1 Tax=Candidatus Organicella extenuata TaxID=2841811 RepID=A0AA51BLT9_9BACT|nr:MAG: hypothetical protein QTO32_00830 [Candidatus Organicella extenuata]